MKKKICKYCKKGYKKRAKELTIFGETFCLHDDKLEFYERMSGQPMRSNPDITVKEAKWGHTRSEKKYIDDAHHRGNAVVRGSDNLLREITNKNK